MTSQSSIISAIKSSSNCHSNNKPQFKKEVLKLFIADQKQKPPEITAQIDGKNLIHTHVNKHFSDSGQIFFYVNPKSPENCLKSKQFQLQSEAIFKEFLKVNPQYTPKVELKTQPSKQSAKKEPKRDSKINEVNKNHTESTEPAKNNSQEPHKQQKPAEKNQIIHEKPKVQYPKIDFIQFLQFWLEKETSIFVFYQKYEENIKKAAEAYRINLYDLVSKNVSQIPSQKKIKLPAKKEESKPEKHDEKTKEPDQVKSNLQKESTKVSDKQKNKTQTESKPKQQLKITEKDSKNQVKPQKTQKNLKKQPQPVAEKPKLLNQVQKLAQKIQSSLDPSSEGTLEHLEQEITDSKPVSCEEIEQQIAVEKVTPTQSFHFFLRKFYDHYCKKYLNTIRNQEFDKVGDFYNSMNLTKFMVYVKDIKLLKLDKSLTAKFLQQQFKAEENQKHCLEYESFAKIVMLSLETAFKTKVLVESKGYEYIGVLNRENFASVMGDLGVIVPSKKIVFSKIQDVRSLSRMVKSMTKQELNSPKHPKVPKENKNTLEELSHGHGFESNWDSNKLHPDLFLNQKQRKQQRLLQGLTIPKLNKLQPSKHMDQKLHEMIDEDYDPYLKRYNESNKSVHEGGSGHGMMKRIDERIHNVVKKIR